MSVESFASVATAIAKLLSAILWPAVVIAVTIAFRPAIRKRIEQGGLTVEAFGAKVSIEHAATVAAALTRAEHEHSGGGSPSSDRDIAQAVVGATQKSTSKRLHGASVLWVDDYPSNNVYERESMEAVGIRFTLSTSNADALVKLSQSKFSAIITDLGRNSSEENDPDGGIHLLRERETRNVAAPCIVYAGTRAIQERALLEAGGAFYATNSPTELFDAVVRAISDDKRSHLTSGDLDLRS